MAELDQIPHCCGINELGYISGDDSPEDTLMEIYPTELRAHVIFSVTSRETKHHAKGRALAKLIADNKLGGLVETAKGAKNTGHRGTIKAWLWTPNKKALKSWQAKMRKANPEKYKRDNYDPYYNPYYPAGW